MHLTNPSEFVHFDPCEPFGGPFTPRPNEAMAQQTPPIVFQQLLDVRLLMMHFSLVLC